MRATVHWSPPKIERRFQSAIAGCDSMQACMGISSLTTISSRQTGCGMLASVWHIRAMTVICMLAFLYRAGPKMKMPDSDPDRLSGEVSRVATAYIRWGQLVLPGRRYGFRIESWPGLMLGAPFR